MGVMLLVVVAVVSSVFLSHPVQERKIGLSLALTGSNASIGERVKNGALLALKEYNSKNSGEKEKVSAIVEDDQSDAKTAVTAFKKLAETDRVSAVIGPIRSDQVLATAVSANEKGVVELSPTGGADEITSAGDFVFRNIETGESHGKGAAVFMKSKGIQSVYVLTGNAANAKTYSAHFKANAENEGISIAGESSYEPKQSDYRTQLLSLTAKHPAAVYIGVTTAPDAGIIVRQLRTLGFKGVVMMSVAADGKEFFEAAGTEVGEVYLTASPLAETEIGKKFVEDYKNTYGVAPDGFAANGYDAMNIALIALDDCGQSGLTKELTSQRACIKNQLYKIKNYDGAGGIVTFDSNGDVAKVVQIKKAIEGVFSVVTE